MINIFFGKVVQLAVGPSVCQLKCHSNWRSYVRNTQQFPFRKGCRPLFFALSLAINAFAADGDWLVPVNASFMNLYNGNYRLRR